MATQNNRSQYIEETALLYETMGLTRMAGRIHGYLMVTDKEQVSFDELTLALQASKSAISANVKALLAVNFIKAMTLPGDRKTYYSLSPDICWTDFFRKRAEQMTIIRNHFDKGLSLRMNKSDKPAQWIKNAGEFYTWMADEFGPLLTRWEEYQAEKKK